MIKEKLVLLSPYIIQKRIYGNEKFMGSDTNGLGNLKKYLSKKAVYMVS